MTKDDFLQMLKRVDEIMPELVHVVNTEMFGYCLDGWDILENYINSELWGNDECAFCFIELFLSQPVRHPWLFGMMLLGAEMYNRSLMFCGD